jgi:hypothetical protein
LRASQNERAESGIDGRELVHRLIHMSVALGKPRVFQCPQTARLDLLSGFLVP